MGDNMSIKEMLHDADPYVRRDACESVQESRSDEYIAELVRVLEDEDLGVREAALNALTAIGGEPVAVAVVPTLGSEDVAIRNIGVEILEQLGSVAVEPVGKILNDSDDDVVKFGVDILSKIKDPRVEGLLAPLVEHKNPNVRAAVVLCMGKVDVATAVPTLLKALGDSEEWVRFSAIEGLGHLEDKGALDALLAIIESESGLVQEAALDAVARIASSEDSIKVLPKVEALLTQGHVLSVGAVVELIEKALMPGSSISNEHSLPCSQIWPFLSSTTETWISSRVRISGLLGGVASMFFSLMNRDVRTKKTMSRNAISPIEAIGTSG